MRRLLAILTALLCALAVAPAVATADVRAPMPLGSGSELYTLAGHRCMAAFAATSGFTGHLIAGPGCPGGTLYSGNNVVVGTVSASPLPNGAVSVVRVTNTLDWDLVPWVPTGSGPITLTGSRETPVGGGVCYYGRASGWRCGTVLAKNVTVYFPWGTIHGLTRTNVCVEPSDIHAAFVSGDQAQGVLIDATGNCTTGGFSYFKPINPILAAYGLTLLTR